MKKKLFNIHKLIGINIILFFFISIFFGILSIYRPYISIWENSSKHISDINVSEINFEKCLKQVLKRKYIGEDGKVIKNDYIEISLPQKNYNISNLIQIKNRPNFYLHPHTCKKINQQGFQLNTFFEKLHYGNFGTFGNIILRILFGFASVAVVFLCLSGLFLILKNKYKNTKTKTVKGYFSKYHRLLLLYTFPLVFMFGLTGALFNIGVYSTPLLTNYISGGKTSNIFALEKNILIDKRLEIKEETKKIKTIPINKLYEKAKKNFKDMNFYKIELYNYKDIAQKVKFIAYEPNTYFISSTFNESSVVFDGINGELISKKHAKDGTFTEKVLDSIFYLHYVRTFEHIPRFIFITSIFIILFGIVFAMSLRLQRARKDKFTYKVLNPLIYTIVLGSLLGTSIAFASTWTIPKNYLHFNFMNQLFNTQAVLFYFSFIFIFVYIKLKKEIYTVVKHCFFLSGIFFLIAVISHNIFIRYNLFDIFKYKLPEEIYVMDFNLILFAIICIYFSFKVKRKYFL